MYSMKTICFLATLLCVHVAAGAAEGRIVDAADGKPIVGAIVTSGRETSLTGPDGLYKLTWGGQDVRARAIGYGRAQLVIADGTATIPTLHMVALRPKALYLSVYGIGSAQLRGAALNLLRETELNALVVDVKGDRGFVPYPTRVSEATASGARNVTTVQDMPAMVASLKRENAYLIARIVSFKDDLFATAHPAWSVKNAHGNDFRDHEGSAWIDPFQRAAWPYLLDLAEEAAEMGFDEIQFDYVRFPDGRDLQFAQANTEANRVAVIAEFLKAARERLAPHNVFLAADIFGYVAWNSSDTNIGQKLEQLLSVVDYLSPMLYPSGYQFGIPGYVNPVEHPYEIVHNTLRHAIERTGVSPLRFRPWLQAFKDYAFDRRMFDADEIRAQINAAEKCGADGWMLWNPRNSYVAAGLREQL
jgi:hypothetical protein